MGLLSINEGIFQRITKSSDAQRDRMLNDISLNDLFQIKNSYETKTLLETILWPINQTKPYLVLQNYVARLLNAVFSSKIGRDYVGSTSIIQSLIWGNNGNLQMFYRPDRIIIESQTAEHLIAAMAKLSLNKFQRQDMIHKGKMSFFQVSLIMQFNSILSLYRHNTVDNKSLRGYRILWKRLPL